MGHLERAPVVTLSPRLAALAAMGTPGATLLAANEHTRIPDGSASEACYRRQPEHIILAGLLGLGRFDARAIEHRVVRIA
jgi:hypothetical protein